MRRTDIPAIRVRYGFPLRLSHLLRQGDDRSEVRDAVWLEAPTEAASWSYCQSLDVLVVDGLQREELGRDRHTIVDVADRIGVP
jgi:hypothetical protein